MSRTCSLFVAIAICASALVGCTPASATGFAPTEIVVSTQATPGGTATPTLTSEEIAAVNAANNYWGDNITNLRFESVQNIGTPSQPEYRVAYQLVYQQIDVWTGSALVFVEADGRVWSNDTFRSDVAVPSVMPSVTADTAIQTAAQTLGIVGEYTVDQAPKLVIYPTGLSSDVQRSYALAWLLVLQTGCPVGTWHMIVNATDGTVLSLMDIMESKLPMVSSCPTPQPLPTLTALPTISPSVTPTPSPFPPPGTPTESGYPAPTDVPVASTSVSP